MVKDSNKKGKRVKFLADTQTFWCTNKKSIDHWTALSKLPSSRVTILEEVKL